MKTSYKNFKLLIDPVKIEKLKDAGWKEFTFKSLGGNGEDWDPDDTINQRILFHPEIEIEQWENEHFDHTGLSDLQDHCSLPMYVEYQSESFISFVDWIRSLDIKKVFFLKIAA